ncbi:MAG: TRAP transporter small permease [Duodenibacillus sp.]|nr:TRAP transporter small permease [Duodenibacillus sp.]
MLKFLDQHFEEVLGSVMLTVMALVAFVNVIIRYCTNLSFAASEEITVNLFVWVVLLGASRAFREGSNFSMNIIWNALSPAPRRIVSLFGIACSIAFFASLVYLGGLEVYDEIDLAVQSESLAIPVWIYTVVTPAISALAIVRIVQKALEDWRHNRL